MSGVSLMALIPNKNMSRITENFRRLSRRLSGIPSFILAAADVANGQTNRNVPGEVPLRKSAPTRVNGKNLLAPSNSLSLTLQQLGFRRQKHRLTYHPSEEGSRSQEKEQDDETIRMEKANKAINERTVQFLSITYAILLVITGAMCTFFNINQPKNQLRDLFMIIVSVIGFLLVGFFHYDINRYRRWALKIIKPMVEEERRRLGRRKSRISLDRKIQSNLIDGDPQNDHHSDNVEEEDDDDFPPYDTVSLNTAAIFDFIDQNNDVPSTPVSLAPPSINSNSNNRQQQTTTSVTFDNDASQSQSTTTEPNQPMRVVEAKPSVNSYTGHPTLSSSKGVAYRYFRGKHANDFYLKIGMIVFCFGSILHIGIDVVKQSYYYIHQDLYCQNGTLILMESVQFVFSFYQLYVIFRYSNIIINRYKNLARFALMHLVGTSISCWLDTIVDEAINDYVELKLSLNSTDETNPLNWIHHCNGTMDMDCHGLDNHVYFVENCSRTAILNNDSFKAFPYLYPFTIEFNIILASIWYMVWSNIGKVKDESLFTESYQTRLMHKYRLANTSSNSNDYHDQAEDNHSYISRRSSLQLTMDCHASNKGLFFGLAILLIILITIIIFFSTIRKSVSFHFGVITYTMQLLLLTFSCFFCIPIAYKRMRCLDVVAPPHRNNAFMMMEDILILIPIPFYFVHYVISAVASLLMGQQSDCNDLVLIGIDILTILQVLIQSPFIVDNLRRCCNDPEMRRKKPGRQLVTLILILNVTLWILNTVELKSVEVFHASHKYFGEFFSMILSHTTLPMMLFYRFHSSVCLSNIWKYAYEKDE